MEFSQATIGKMKQWYRDYDGTEISDFEANEAWTNLCEYFKLLYEIDQGVKKEASEDQQRSGPPLDTLIP